MRAAAAVRVVSGLPGSGSVAPPGLVGMKPSLLTADPGHGDVDPGRAGVGAQWTLSERSVNAQWTPSERSVVAQWTLSERLEIARR